MSTCCPHSPRKTSKVSKNNYHLGSYHCFMVMKWNTFTSWHMLSGFGTSCENSDTYFACLAQTLVCMNDVISSNCRHVERRPALL